MGALDGKVAFVTGATSGIGRAVALAYAAEGASVAGCGRDEAALASLAGDLGDRGIALPCDVTDESSIETAVRDTVERLGGLDVAFNCAGMGGMSTIRAGDLAVAEQIWRTNVLGVLACMKYQSRIMAERGGGSIINVSSASGVQAAAGLAAYCGSKAAVDMITRAAAVELGPHHIRVNALAPGTTLTRMTEWTQLPGVEDSVAAATPLGRLGQPGDMTGMAILLASDASSFITGQVLYVDGGVSLSAFPDIRKLLRPR
jgi:NAD(P)-dependent dehydrogenase (short-subunit alcohol dehydrogenase family)